MGSIGQVVLGTSALFLALMAVLIDSPGLFYMCTAMLATLGVCRLQALGATNNLRFQRIMPAAVTAGELTTVELDVIGDRSGQRQLVIVEDSLPVRMHATDVTPTLPVAPGSGQPVRTRYHFRPQRRGRFAWKGVTVVGVDALGLAALSRDVPSDTAELIVYPRSIPVMGVPYPIAGYGAYEPVGARHKGAGIELRGIRDYATGDPLRHVHWASTARTGKLMVKEFDASSGLEAHLIVQRTMTAPSTVIDFALDELCGRARYLAEEFTSWGAKVIFPTLESDPGGIRDIEAREAAICELLALVEPTRQTSLAAELKNAAIPADAAVVILLALPEDGVDQAIRRLNANQVTVVALTSTNPQRRPSNWEAFLGSLEATGAKIVRAEVSQWPS